MRSVHVTQEDVRMLVGWTQDQDELRQQEGIADEWLLLEQQGNERLRQYVFLPPEALAAAMKNHH